MRAGIIVTICVLLGAAPALAVEPSELCQARELTGSGKRILAKLRCYAKAKRRGREVHADCLDRAEKAFVMFMAKGGLDCQVPDELVAAGAGADAQMSGVVRSVNSGDPGSLDVSGSWESHTVLAIDPDGGVSLDCAYYPPNACPSANLIAITDCVTEVTQSGGTITHTSECTTPANSPVQLGSFSQAATGTIDPLTGEWTLSGSVTVPNFATYFYDGEGVYSPDGQTMTGFTTAGFAAGESLWLASTTGHRVD